MNLDTISDLIKMVSEKNLKDNLFYLAKDPLPYRKLNYTIPGHSRNTLYEADDFIEDKLKKYGCKVEKEGVKVQAFGRDITKPKIHQFAHPPLNSPWYTAYNLYVKKKGKTYPDEIILIVSHKDSQSWVDSPGAYDNVSGTISNMEIARILANYESERSLWFLFCNEEHTPWTSVTAANNAKSRGDNLIVIFNLDCVGGKSKEEAETGVKTNVTLYTTDEGEKIADLMEKVNSIYKIRLIQRKYRRKIPGDDDSSFIKAGYPMAVANFGSYPYADPNYHDEKDIPELVDIQNIKMTTQAILAAILRIDKEGIK